ncbi:MAG TPA: VOC family protein [Verrucomicrobiae bacterium]|jgi:catechol 2,3-dioxygenase-like lactoylglutathione lyase family enzyme|nr:VOC family protein [Verrucomicrobiae bacterium]
MKKKPAKKAVKKAAPRKPVAKKAAPKKAVSKRAVAPSAKRVPAKVQAPAAPAPQPGDKLTFNHAMIYAKDVQRALDFYREWLGFRLIEDFRYEGKSVYARMRAPGGDGTIAIHQAGPGASVASDGVRLYFEVRDLDDFCRKLQKRGFYFTQLPTMMPWGWRHAYLNDPEGHEISLYWAGENRMQKTVMQAAKRAAK